MKNLTPLSLAWASKMFEIAELCEEPRRTRVLNAKGSLAPRFGEFHRRKYDLFPVVNSVVVEPLKSDFLYCYTSSKAPLNEMKLKIAEVQDATYGTLCQYCGVDHASSTDHYIPKDLFPEFSVLPINLVPCCRVCNQTKWQRWRDADGRTIINFYFDPIPSERFLHAEVVTPPGRAAFAEFYLDFDHRISHATQRLISKHFENLKLLPMYKTESGQNIALAKNLLQMLMGHQYHSDSAIQQQLRQLSDRYKSQYGQNHWKAILFESISVYPHLMR